MVSSCCSGMHPNHSLKPGRAPGMKSAGLRVMSSPLTPERFLNRSRKIVVRADGGETSMKERMKLLRERKKKEKAMAAQESPKKAAENPPNEAVEENPMEVGAMDTMAERMKAIKERKLQQMAQAQENGTTNGNGNGKVDSTAKLKAEEVAAIRRAAEEVKRKAEEAAKQLQTSQGANAASQKSDSISQKSASASQTGQKEGKKTDGEGMAARMRALRARKLREKLVDDKTSTKTDNMPDGRDAVAAEKIDATAKIVKKEVASPEKQPVSNATPKLPTDGVAKKAAPGDAAAEANEHLDSAQKASNSKQVPRKRFSSLAADGKDEAKSMPAKSSSRVSNDSMAPEGIATTKVVKEGELVKQNLVAAAREESLGAMQKIMAAKDAKETKGPWSTVITKASSLAGKAYGMVGLGSAKVERPIRSHRDALLDVATAHREELEQAQQRLRRSEAEANFKLRQLRKEKSDMRRQLQAAQGRIRSQDQDLKEIKMQLAAKQAGLLERDERDRSDSIELTNLLEKMLSSDKQPDVIPAEMRRWNKKQVPTMPLQTSREALAGPKTSTVPTNGANASVKSADGAHDDILPRLSTLLLRSFQLLIAALAGAILLPVVFNDLNAPIGEALSNLQRQAFAVLLNSHGWQRGIVQSVQHLLGTPLCILILWMTTFTFLTILSSFYYGVSKAVFKLFRFFQQQKSGM